MSESSLRIRAKNYFYLLTILFILAQFVFLTELEAVGDGDLIGGIYFSCLFMVFIILTIKGFNWAKWVLTTLLLFFSILFLFAGFDIPSLKLKIVGLYYLLFGLIPHLSKRLKPITIRKNIKDETSQKEELRIPDNLLIDEKAHRFPYLINRYKAMLIDGLLLLIFITICVEINSKLDFSSTWILVLYIIAGLSYEPILISYSSTIGQRVMGIRVRHIEKPNERISIGQAYMRFFTKALLGWLSFLTISFNKERRAIHDMVASSVVIELQSHKV